jgi:two-component system KDP operon response regulator KdpE
VPERILAVEDEYLILELIRRVLERSHYEVITAADGPTALRLFHETKPHLVLLDLILPGLSGWEVCSQIRNVSTVPIIMLTRLQSQDDIVKGLNIGADDYVVKPFTTNELLARVQAVLRRTRMLATIADMPLRFSNGDLIIDTTNRQVMVYGRVVELTPKEYELLLYMAQHAGRVLSAADIFAHVWSYDTQTGHANVKWYIWRLRSKIEQDAARPRFIITQRGSGYRFTLL